MKWVFVLTVLAIIGIAFLYESTCLPHSMEISGHLFTGTMCGNDIQLDDNSVWISLLVILGAAAIIVLPDYTIVYFISLWIMCWLSVAAHYASTTQCQDITGKYDGLYCQNSAYDRDTFRGKYYSHTGDYTVE